MSDFNSFGSDAKLEKSTEENEKIDQVEIQMRDDINIQSMEDVPPTGVGSANYS